MRNKRGKKEEVMAEITEDGSGDSPVPTFEELQEAARIKAGGKAPFTTHVSGPAKIVVDGGKLTIIQGGQEEVVYLDR